jgi:23S rRNA pseudouridine1911/1915/1917 synthase
MTQLQVPPAEAGSRLDHFLSAQLAHLSRARIQHLIREGSIRLNDAPVKPGARLRNADWITVMEPPEPVPSLDEPEEIPLEILWEDEHLIVINKPAGLVVHPGAGNAAGTLVNALLHHCTGLSGIGGERRPGIVHRLDKETSGCLVAAKNDRAHAELARQFATREVTKLYLALAAGVVRSKSFTIDVPIGRHRVHRQKMAVLDSKSGRHARTDFRVLQTGPDWTLLECRLHTGRTHQIRVHLQHAGHPVLGDKVYGGRHASTFPRHMLHAWQLGFRHPLSGDPLQFTAPLPHDFSAAGAIL